MISSKNAEVIGVRRPPGIAPWVLVALCCGVAACHRSQPVKEIPDVDADNAQVAVSPFQNPAVERMMQDAATLRQSGDTDGAMKIVKQALGIAPRDPEVLQELAELELLDGDFKSADRLARQSFSLGPKIGPLCERNWNTVALAAPRIGDDRGVQEAARELPQCALDPVPHVDDSLP